MIKNYPCLSVNTWSVVSIFPTSFEICVIHVRVCVFNFWLSSDMTFYFGFSNLLPRTEFYGCHKSLLVLILFFRSKCFLLFCSTNLYNIMILFLLKEFQAFYDNSTTLWRHLIVSPSLHRTRFSSISPI